MANAAARARLRPGTTEMRDLLSELEWAACTLVSPEDYPAAAAAGRARPAVRRGGRRAGLRAYGDLKQAQGVVDFDDLLLLTAAVLEEHADVAEEFRARYRSFVVDEYQDVTPLQQRLLDAWLGGRDDLCVVGDAQPDDLLLHRRHARPPARLPRAASRTRPRCGWSATTARRRRWSGWPTR